MKKRAFRTELLAELRELVSVGRRVAAVAEQGNAMRERADESRGREPAGFIHTRGPREGEIVASDEWDQPRWLECWDTNIIATPSRTVPSPFCMSWDSVVRLTDISIDMYDELTLHRGEHGRDGGEVLIDDEGKRIRLNVTRTPKVGTWTAVEEQM